MVTKSAKGNIPLIVNKEFKIYNWSDHLSQLFSAIPALLSYHHIVFTKEKVSVTRHQGDESLEGRVMNPQPLTLDSMPLKSGIYEAIREICRAGTEDLVAPLPETSKPDEIIIINFVLIMYNNIYYL